MGAASSNVLTDAVELLKKLNSRNDIKNDYTFPPESGASALNIERVLAKTKSRRETIFVYINAYREYCWPVNSIDDLKLASFYILATEKKIHELCFRTAVAQNHNS